MTLTHAPIFSSQADVAAHLTQALTHTLLDAYQKGKEITQSEIDALRQTVATLFDDCQQKVTNQVAMLEKEYEQLSDALSLHR
jgi:hypothetical protein